MSEKTKKHGKKQKKEKNNEKSSENTNHGNIKEKLRKKEKQTENSEVEKKSVKFHAETIDNEVEGNPSPKKKRKARTSEEPEELAPLSEELEAEIQRPENVKNVDSKRFRKREKHKKLLAENKLKSETHMQQRALNYLSLWKHNRQEWKFEKIRQIWIQTHMFDAARVPDEFWETTINYFGGSKGRIRQVLIDNCMKIVEEAEKDDERVKSDAEDDDDDKKSDTEAKETKFKRARELLQNLQE